MVLDDLRPKEVVTPLMQETPAVQATQDAFPLDIRSAEAGIVRLVAREGLHAVIEIVLA